MDLTVLAAIIGAIAAVAAAVIAHLLERRRKARLQIVDISLVEMEGAPKTLRLAELAVMGYPDRALFPVVDFKLANSGDAVAFLKRLELEVLESSLDATPILEYSLRADQNGNLLITIKNAGWGPALKMSLDNLIEKPIRDCLKLSECDYRWQGEIKSRGVVEMVLPSSLIREGAVLPPIVPSGFAQYYDQEGAQYVECVDYHPYPFEECKLEIGNGKFLIRYRDYAAGVEPSRKYTLFFEAQSRTRTKSLEISHKIAPNDVERFQVVLASDKSLNLKLSAKIYFNANRVIKSKPFEARIYHPNELWYYHHGREPRQQLSQDAPTFYDEEEVIASKYNEFGFNRFYRSSRYRLRWPPSDEALRLAPVEALNEIGWTLIDQEIDVDGGLRLAAEAVAREPGCAIYLDTLGWGFYKKGQYEEAVEWLSRAVEQDPEDQLLQAHLHQAREKAREILP